MADKNFIMKQKTSGGYDTLYPQTTDEQVKLSDNVQDLFRVENGTVNNALAQLGFYNQYFWKRRSVVSGYYEKRTKTTRGTWLTDGRRLFAFVVENSQQTIQYSSNITINQSTGLVSLSNPQIITLPNASASSLQTAQILKGKYFMGGTDAQSSQIYYIEDFAQIQRLSISDPEYGVYDEICVEVNREPYNVYEITSQYIATYGDWEIVYSTNRNQYPDDGIVGQYKYLFLNKPLDNAIDTVKIATGTYVGTGVAGSSNQNSLTFNFIPKMLIICKEMPNGILGLLPYNYNSNQLLPWHLSGIWFEGQNRLQVFDFTLGQNMVNVSHNTISWYTTNAGTSYAAPQLNAQGYTYHYIAIG